MIASSYSADYTPVIRVHQTAFSDGIRGWRAQPSLWAMQYNCSSCFYLMVMSDYTPCHRASDRYAPDATAAEGEIWRDEQSEAVDFYEALDDEWLVEDLSDRAQAYEQTEVEVRSTDVPFPELIEAAIQVMQAAQDAGIDF